jgi:hypothetical protein
MLINSIKIFFYYLLGNLLYLLNQKKINIRLYFAIKSNNKFSFRLPQKSDKDILITFRIIKRLCFDLIRKKNTIYILDENSKSFIIDCSNSSIKLRENYVNNLIGSNPGAFISKNDLISYQGLFQTLFWFIFIMICFVPLLMMSFFLKKKYHLTLQFVEFIELNILVRLLKKNKATKIHYFSIYERESNMWALMLMKFGYYVNKIPSEVPLCFNNSIIIADELSICFEYQKKEVEHFKNNMFIDKVTTWAPETIYQAPERFLNKNRSFEKQSFDIGFFSSAIWLRNYLNEIELSKNDKQNEELLLQLLIRYCKNKNLKLLIFLHPLEKKEQNEILVSNYYENKIDNKTVYLWNKNKKSIEGFDCINIGIALYSTLMFERIFLGFKTILAPFDYPEFPLQNSELINISAKNEKELFYILDINLELNPKEFFIKNKLQNYTSYLN